MNVLLNLYLKDKSNLFQSEVISFNRKIKTLDDARILIIKYLGNNYSSCKYNINIYNSFDGKESSINIIFEEAIFIKRDIMLKDLLND
jgi:hypothetical protein